MEFLDAVWNSRWIFEIPPGISQIHVVFLRFRLEFRKSTWFFWNSGWNLEIPGGILKFRVESRNSGWNLENPPGISKSVLKFHSDVFPLSVSQTLGFNFQRVTYQNLNWSWGYNFVRFMKKSLYNLNEPIHFCLPIFGWLIFFKSENFDAVAIHQFLSKWTDTKPQWLILVNITTNFAPVYGKS